MKPWDNQKLLATMKTAVNLTQSRRQVKTLQKDTESLKTELKGMSKKDAKFFYK